MKLITPYYVAVYSTQKCTLFDQSDINEIAHFFSRKLDQASMPDQVQLSAIQKHIPVKHYEKVIVVVPDQWVCVSQHHIHHSIPSALAPLAALTYAVESTFASPETVLFNYQQTEVLRKQTRLTVFACNSEWAAQLCSPFQQVGAICYLMSYTQWVTASLYKLSWSSLRRQALSVYQPNKEKQKKAKHCWVVLVFLSVLICAGGSFYLWLLQEQKETARLESDNVQRLKTDWESDQVTSPFPTSILIMARALPNSVRLVQFDADVDRAVLRVTLLQKELSLLIERWRHEHMSWRFEWTARPHDPMAVLEGEGVMDATISISKNE